MKNKLITIISVLILLCSLSFVSAAISPPNNLNGYNRYSIQNYINLSGTPIEVGTTAGVTGNCVGRPLVSVESRNITVPNDYATIQEAICQVPYYLKHPYRIDVADGTYNEDLVIPSITVDDSTGMFMNILTNPSGRGEGAVVGLTLEGNASNRNAVEINSILITGVRGAQTPNILHFKMLGSEPTSDENASISIYGSSHASIKSMNFTGVNANVGIMGYGSSFSYGGNDFGDDDLDQAIRVKHGGMAFDSEDSFNYGSVKDVVVKTVAGTISYLVNNNVSAPNGVCDPDRGMCVENDGTVFGIYRWTTPMYAESTISGQKSAPYNGVTIYQDGGGDTVRLNGTQTLSVQRGSATRPATFFIGNLDAGFTTQADESILIKYLPDETTEYLRVSSTGDITQTGDTQLNGDFDMYTTTVNKTEVIHAFDDDGVSTDYNQIGFSIDDSNQRVKGAIGFFGEGVSRGRGTMYIATRAAADNLDVTPDDAKITIDRAGTATFFGNVIPSTNDTWALGSATNYWSDLFVGNSTIHICNAPNDCSALSRDADKLYYNDKEVVLGALKEYPEVALDKEPIPIIESILDFVLENENTIEDYICPADNRKFKCTGNDKHPDPLSGTGKTCYIRVDNVDTYRRCSTAWEVN